MGGRRRAGSSLRQAKAPAKRSSNISPFPPMRPPFHPPPQGVAYRPPWGGGRSAQRREKGCWLTCSLFHLGQLSLVCQAGGRGGWCGVFGANLDPHSKTVTLQVEFPV